MFVPHRYWWLKLTALADKADWEELEKFAKSKKSPIGYLVKRNVDFVIHVNCIKNCPVMFAELCSQLQHFVEACVKRNNKYEAKKYVSKVTPEQKVKAHLAVG